MMEKISIRRTLCYREVLELQKAEFERRIDERKRGVPLSGDIVFFVEHRPVYTIGLHGDISHLLMDDSERAEREIEFYQIGRGGDITYHGPGQLTVYPIMDMQRYRLGVKEYVTLLEQAVIDTLEEYGIKGERIEGRTGVWIEKGKPYERKICAIGIKCSRHVSMHGFAFNVGPDLSGFNGIVPCGLPQGVTSLSRETGREITMDEAEEKIWGNLTRLLRSRIPFPGNS